jgi:hypothetical protein
LAKLELTFGRCCGGANESWEIYEDGIRLE